MATTFRILFGEGGEFKAAKRQKGDGGGPKHGAENVFVIPNNGALPEFVVGCKFTIGATTRRCVSRCSLLTNQGRWSPWFGTHNKQDGPELFIDVFPETANTCVVSVKAVGSKVEFETEKAPKHRPKSRKTLIALGLSARAALTKSHGKFPSPLHQVRSGSLLKRLPKAPPRMLSFEPSLLRLLVESNDPCSVFKAITFHGKGFDASLLDLMLLREPNESITSLSCLHSPVLKTSIVRMLLRRSSKQASLARLALTPCVKRGAPSIMKLITDDETLDDIEKPSLLRMMLLLEDKKDSLFRMLLERNFKLHTSITELLLEEPKPWRKSLARLVLEDNVLTGKVSRFLSDSGPGGKIALAKYLLAGGKHSIARKSLAGERLGEYSILRLLVIRPDGGIGDSLVEVLGKRLPALGASLLDLMVEDDIYGVNLARICFQTMIRVKEGVLDQFSNAHLPPALVEIDSVLSDKGISLAHFFLSGEVTNRMSMMRALIIGEEPSDDNTGVTSVLRLLAEMDPSQPGQPPLLAIVLSEMRRLFANQRHSGASQLHPVDFLPFIAQLSSELKKRGKEFAARWKAAWLFVSRRILKSAELSAPCTAEWRKMAPLWAALCVDVAKKRWSKVAMRASRIAVRLDQGHGNRFMMSGRIASKAVKAGVATGFAIPKGILSALSEATAPLPITSRTLTGVGGILSLAEGVTQTTIDLATTIGLEATGIAYRAHQRRSQKKKKKKDSDGKDQEEKDSDGAEDDADKGEESLIATIGSILIDDDEGDDDDGADVNDDWEDDVGDSVEINLATQEEEEEYNGRRKSKGNQTKRANEKSRFSTEIKPAEMKEVVL